MDRLYDDIRHELQGQKDLQIVSEYNGTMNSIPLLSDVAVNKSPKIWAGALREFCVYITRGPNYYAVEVASGIGLEAECGQVLWDLWSVDLLVLPLKPLWVDNAI